MSLLQVGETVGDRYVVEAEIGRGGMQEVYRAHDDTLRRSVALKVPQDARVARKFRDSAVISARVNHPNVAKTLDYFEDEDGRFYLVEEYVDGLDMKRILAQFKRCDPHTAAHVMHHLARGVAASHRAGVVHRDLKPSNIMIPGGLQFAGMKITDFGIAKMAEHEIDEAVSGGEETTQSSRTVMNALAYVAPEVVDQPRTASKPSDVWAVAAITW
ncbi:MAG: serine/threonine-protein kinase, partial [Vicinamibacterales bacterium]